MSTYNIDALLKKAYEMGASDVHIIVGEVPSFRIDGKIFKTNLRPVTEDDMLRAIDDIAPISMRDKIFKSFDSDFPYEIEGVCRFRVNLAMTFGYHSMTIRMISALRIHRISLSQQTLTSFMHRYRSTE